jgi:hypothetical protein
MGIAGSLLLVVALQVTFNMLPGEFPANRFAASPDRTGPSANALLDSRKEAAGNASSSANPVDSKQWVIYTAGSKTKVFHHETCAHLNRSTNGERMTRAEAERRNLTPCIWFSRQE